MTGSRDSESFDAIIVGAGFSGLYMLYRLRALGLSTKLIEAGTGVGGTWYWNRYPGACCDTESVVYSYSFSKALEQEWQWTTRYPQQSEILRYINHVADRFELRRDIQLETRVIEAHFDEEMPGWRIATDQGGRYTAQFCIMATGAISAARVPGFEGLADFEGDWYHTARWPHETVDFTGKRVGVIGTGSSGIQAIPVIAEQAAHLTVFQRTANFCTPAWDGPLDPVFEREIKTNYPAYRQQARESRGGNIDFFNPQSALAVGPEERERTLEKRWADGGIHMQLSFGDLLTNQASNDLVAEFVRNKIREKVQDPEVAELLCPADHPFATKRLCQDTSYYETYNRDNVTLVDVKHSPIERITAHGVKVGNVDYELDAIVFATGFDALTGALLDIDIRGRTGEVLKDKWTAGPRAYLGLAIAGFPNLFTVTGPGSPSVLSNMMVSLEQHVDWIAACIDYLGTHDLEYIEATLESEDQWVQHVNQTAGETLYPKANSWYMGANIPDKARVFLPYVGGVGNYRKICDRVTVNGYEGFALR